MEFTPLEKRRKYETNNNANSIYNPYNFTINKCAIVREPVANVST